MEKHAVNAKTTTGPLARRAAVLALVLAAGLPAAAMAQERPLTAEEYKKQADAAVQQALRDQTSKEQAGQTSEEEIAKKRAAAEAAQKAAAAQAAAMRNAAQPGSSSVTGPNGTVTHQPGQGPGGIRVEGQQPGTGAGTGSGRVLAPDEVELSAFSEAVELKTLVEWVAETLQINVVAFDALTGSVVLNAPVVVKKQDLLKLLNSLLEQQNYMITKDDTGWYKVLPANGIIYRPGTGDLFTTRVIPTPTVKPSSLAQAINDQIGMAAAPTGGGTGVRYSYMDELGVIIATDSPRRLDALSALVEQILSRSNQIEWTTLPLQYIAPVVARQRLLDLLGQAQMTTGAIQIVNPGQPNAVQANQPTGNITNVADRLIADQTSNALLFRGFPDEVARVQDMLTIIDRPNSLHYAKYFAGSGALQIAQLAERLGLGHVEPVDASNVSQTNTQNPQQINFQIPGQGGGRNNQPVVFSQNQQNQTTSIGGPVMIVDTVRNNIIYYGTDQQHTQLADLISKFDTELEQVVIVTYKLKNKPAVDVADVLNGIAFNQAVASNSDFLPGNNFFNNLNRQFGGNNNQFNNGTNNRTTNNRTGTTGTNSSTRTNQNRTQRNQGNTSGGQRFQPGSAQAALAEGADPLGGPDVFILADPSNNQVIVKAPAKQQEEFARVIAKLDQRTPQVYIEVQIVAVTATDEFRLAFETQFQAGQFNTNTNWAAAPLGSLLTGTGAAATGDLRNTKQVNAGLNGVTAALIKSSYVPIVVNALKANTDSRILASPHLLVDDNVEAEIVSLEEQPTSSTTINASTTSNNFNGYEQAGTRLTVTPSISEGGYMRLMYEIELSNFVGQGANGFPPPKQTRNVRSDSVTVPGDTTIIVGGITLDEKNETIAKIPLLGNIPLLGYLFRDTNLNNSTTRLYIFITPRIFRDTNFRDPILHTKGWREEAGIAPDYPELRPAIIEMVGANMEPTPAEPSAEPKPKVVNKKKASLRLWPDPGMD